jgi:hypothetical protein
MAGNFTFILPFLEFWFVIAVAEPTGSHGIYPNSLGQILVDLRRKVKGLISVNFGSPVT